MKSNFAYFALLMWASVLQAEDNPSPENTPGAFSFSNNRLVAPGSSSSSLDKDKDYSDAIYAGRFAVQLDRLEKQENEVFANFISAGFLGDEIPRELPTHLQMLSRTDPPTEPSFPLSQTRFGRFRFPEEGEEVFVERPRAFVDPQIPDFPASIRRPLSSSRRFRRPTFANNFGPVPLTRRADPEALFSLNHRFTPF